ncbi:MAG TPA: hypothetical protein VLT10_00285 [Verrucomicrobiae bacterium]|nr:hypothetical protein [Verrucomicrobiae bacterium]
MERFKHDKIQKTSKNLKKGFEFGDLVVEFYHPVTIKNENKHGDDP